jgi:hypothetical protein
LKTGHTKSCGCLFPLAAEISNAKRFVDLEGRRFGRLRVVEMKRKVGHVFYWDTVCDCGNYFLANGNRLKAGSAQSCGCLRNEKISIANKSRVLKRGEGGRFVNDNNA